MLRRFIKKISSWQFFRFCLIGVINTIADFLIVNFLAYLFQIYQGGYLILINSFSFIIVVTISFFLNKGWTFKTISQSERIHSVKKQYFLFFLINTVGMVLNSTMVYILTTIIGRQFGVGPVIWLNFSKIIAVGIILFWNFFNSKHIVFREKVN